MGVRAQMLEETMQTTDCTEKCYLNWLSEMVEIWASGGGSGNKHGGGEIVAVCITSIWRVHVW